MYLLTIRGSVRDHKFREFEQTYRLLLPQLPEACNHASLYQDLLSPGQYLFISEWDSELSARDYLTSEMADTLLGAFRVLGELDEQALGEVENLEKESPAED